MKVRLALALVVCGPMLLTPSAAAQMTMRPADKPVVTAERETWYLEGEPITYDGGFYYPAGPEVFFNPWEMVRSGSYRGVPLYARTMVEPYSVVYVPVARGLLQPYERRRRDQLAGTTGTSAPSFPVQRDLEVRGDFLAQAPAEPLLGDVYYELEPFDERVVQRAGDLPRSAASAGPHQVPRQALRSALRPVGLNAFYIDYDGVRWFNSGPAALVNPDSLTRRGEYHGFPVYGSADRGADTILVPVGETAEAMMTPYTRRD